MAADDVVFLDNVNATNLRSNLLASVITERPAIVRPLGSSAVVRINSTSFVALTGNGLKLSKDLTRRFLVSELEAGMENPAGRAFRGDFIHQTMERRAELLSAALIIWRWGRQQGSDLPAGASLGSFEEWSRGCRDPLLALGCRDPVLRVADAQASDPQRQAVMELFLAWHEAHGCNYVSAYELAPSVVEAAGAVGRPRQFVAALVCKLERTRLGGFLLESKRRFWTLRAAA
jgi:hypothetical protein